MAWPLGSRLSSDARAQLHNIRPNCRLGNIPLGIIRTQERVQDNGRRPSARQPRPYTSGVRSRPSSASQTTGSNEEDLYDYRDPWEPEMDRLEDNNCNWAMELWAHHAHITRYEKAAHDVWQRQYETYTSLLELAEH